MCSVDAHQWNVQSGRYDSVCGWVLMFYVPGVQRVWSLNEGSEDSFGYAG